MNQEDNAKRSPQPRMKRAQRLMGVLAEQNSRSSEIVDEIVSAECDRQDSGASESSKEFDRTAEMFAIHSLILNESTQK